VILVIAVVALVIARVVMFSRRKRAAELDERRTAAAHRDGTDAGSRETDRADVAAQEQAAQAERQRLESEEQARRAEQERAAAEHDETQAPDIDPDKDN
jgi:flagellar biosynthesis/type III secretory pathway M-ring protein FliF/YscJ